MTGARNVLADMLEKQVPLLESEGFPETAEEAANRAQLLRLLDMLENM